MKWQVSATSFFPSMHVALVPRLHGTELTVSPRRDLESNLLPAVSVLVHSSRNSPFVPINVHHGCEICDDCRLWIVAMIFEHSGGANIHPMNIIPFRWPIELQLCVLASYLMTHEYSLAVMLARMLILQFGAPSLIYNFASALQISFVAFIEFLRWITLAA
jgi:hypothetical protein